MQPHLHDARLNGHDFDIATVGLDVRAHEIHDGTDARQQFLGAFAFDGSFTLS